MKKPAKPVKKRSVTKKDLQVQIDVLRRTAADADIVDSLTARIERLEAAELLQRTGVDTQFHSRLEALENLRDAVVKAPASAPKDLGTEGTDLGAWHA